jgi:hypothetical protein
VNESHLNDPICELFVEDQKNLDPFLKIFENKLNLFCFK